MYAIVLLEQFIFVLFHFFLQRNVPIHRFTIPEIRKITVFLNVDSMQLFKSSYIPTVANEWNILSVDTRQSESIRIF